MKQLLILLLFFISSQADEKDLHEFYAAIYLPSLHFTKNDETGEAFNEKHDVYGVEYIYQNKYTFTYNNFINSRGNEVDTVGAGYLLPFSKSFGLHLIAGFQEGYCLDGFLHSVECIEGKNNKGGFLLPLLYYKHKYFKLDFFSNGNMVAFKLNLKLNDLFKSN